MSGRQRRQDIRARLGLGLVALAIGCAHADDWNYYALAPGGKNGIAAFYSESSTKQLSPGHLRVWTKGIFKVIVEAYQRAGDDAQTARIDRKLGDHYHPPIWRLGALPEAKLRSVLFYEDIANYSPVEPVMKRQLELDCGAAMYRSLSYEGPDPETKGPQTVNVWRHATDDPEVVALLKVVCAEQADRARALRSRK